jgi:cysteinyl-tRNA synthetase
MKAQNMDVDDVLLGARDRFTEVMDHDLNSSGALAVLFELAKPLKSLANRLERGDQLEQQEGLNALHQRWLLLRELAAVLGLRHEPLQAIAETSAASENSVDIEAAISARKAAKQAKDFAEADRIRDQLSAQGIELIDKPGGITEWRRI